MLIRNRKLGFTLMELLIVLGIVGILSVAGFASYATTQKNSRDARRRLDVEQIRASLELYRSDSSSYPAGTGNAYTVLRTPLASPIQYMNSNKFPNDPQSATGPFYYYERTGTNTFNLCALLEVTPPTNQACLNASADCSTASGVQTCNYGVAQP